MGVLPQGVDEAASFWSRVRRGAACWTWDASLDAEGYGAVWWQGRRNRAHRVAWILTNGEVPPRCRVRQICGNRTCCRPEHLELREPGRSNDPVRRALSVRRQHRTAIAGKGHVERRGPNNWRLAVYRGRDRTTGRRRYERRAFHGTQDEAQVALARFIVELADANYELEPGNLTFGDVLDLWYEHVQPDLEPTTAETYRHELGYVPERLRALPLKRLSTEHLEELYLQLRTSGRRRDSRGLSQKFVRSIHQRVDTALRFAKRRRWIMVNPAAEVEFANARKSDRRRPTPAPLADVQSVLRRAEDTHGLAFAVYLRVSAAAGGRRGELHGLRWTGVDWRRGRVRLADNIVRAGPAGWTVKRSPKDDEPRLVALGPATMGMLRRLLLQAETAAANFSTKLDKDAFVFSDAPDGSRPWVPTTTWLRYKRLCEECGVEATRLHDLRAMMSTELIEHGMPVSVVSARLGHAQNSTTAMTLDVYTGRNPELDQSAGELMDRLLDG
jgi:integrase